MTWLFTRPTPGVLADHVELYDVRGIENAAYMKTKEGEQEPRVALALRALADGRIGLDEEVAFSDDFTFPAAIANTGRGWRQNQVDCFIMVHSLHDLRNDDDVQDFIDDFNNLRRVMDRRRQPGAVPTPLLLVVTHMDKTDSGNNGRGGAASSKLSKGKRNRKGKEATARAGRAGAGAGAGAGAASDGSDGLDGHGDDDDDDDGDDDQSPLEVRLRDELALADDEMVFISLANTSRSHKKAIPSVLQGTDKDARARLDRKLATFMRQALIRADASVRARLEHG